MKKILMLVAVATMNLGYAQKTTFGLKTGYSLSTLKSEVEEFSSRSHTTDPLHSFYIGGVATHRINDNFGLQGELLYGTQGGTETFRYQEETAYSLTKTKVEMHMLQIPVSGKYFINDAFSVSAGVNFEFILSAKLNYVAYENQNMPEMDIIPDPEYDVTDQMKSVHIAPFAGAEYSLKNGMFFDARYHPALFDLQKDSGRLTHGLLQAGVGYRFGGGHKAIIISNI